MAFLIVEAFEDSAGFNKAVGLEASLTYARTGLRSLNITTGLSADFAEFGGWAADLDAAPLALDGGVAFLCYLYTPAGSLGANGDEAFLAIHEDGDETNWWFKATIDQSGVVKAQANGGSLTSLGTLASATWTKLEFRVTAAGAWHAVLGSGSTQSLGTSDPSTTDAVLCFGDVVHGAVDPWEPSKQVYVDDLIAVNDGSAYYGKEVQVVPHKLSANGSRSGWGGWAGSYTEWDGVPSQIYDSGISTSTVTALEDAQTDGQQAGEIGATIIVVHSRFQLAVRGDAGDAIEIGIAADGGASEDYGTHTYEASGAHVLGMIHADWPGGSGWAWANIGTDQTELFARFSSQAGSSGPKITQGYLLIVSVDPVEISASLATSTTITAPISAVRQIVSAMSSSTTLSGDLVGGVVQLSASMTGSASVTAFLGGTVHAASATLTGSASIAAILTLASTAHRVRWQSSVRVPDYTTSVWIPNWVSRVAIPDYTSPISLSQ